MTTKLAIVTGASRGIGAAVARMLVDRSWTVVGIARSGAAFEHAGYHHITMDLALVATAPRSLHDALAPHIARATGRVGLVNNAALVGHLGPLVTADPTGVLELHAVNVVAPVWLMGEVVRSAPAPATVRIVNVSTGAAVGAYPGLGAYSMSKAALRMAGMSLASEWDDLATRKHKRSDAAILSYEPGLVDTDMQRESREQPTGEFPWDMFRGFARDKLLVPPERPAAEIVEFLESGKQKSFAERRLRD
jgi:benzil reductase ((S)-benzoin forming)